LSGQTVCTWKPQGWLALGDVASAHDELEAITPQQHERHFGSVLTKLLTQLCPAQLAVHTWTVEELLQSL
jgi:hypothetical protein